MITAKPAARRGKAFDFDFFGDFTLDISGLTLKDLYDIVNDVESSMIIDYDVGNGHLCDSDVFRRFQLHICRSAIDFLESRGLDRVPT